MKVNLIYIIILAFLVATLNSIAQEIEANVTVNTDQLSLDAKINVQTMKSDVENYINNQKFTDINWEGPKIPVEISIVLTGGANSRYAGRLLIVSKRTLDGPEGSASVALRLIDNKWSFEYTRFASLSYNPLRYQEFSSLLDFYMLLVIGMDMDTYGELEGTGIYEKAKQICLLGASNNADGFETHSKSPGEFTRYNLVNELTDMRYDEFRRLIFSYYVDGLDKMSANKDEALKTLDGIITDMGKFKKDKMVGSSVLLQAFLDAKGLEFAQLFKDYSDKSVYDTLMYLDPTNTSEYQEAKKSR